MSTADSRISDWDGVIFITGATVIGSLIGAAFGQHARIVLLEERLRGSEIHLFNVNIQNLAAVNTLRHEVAMLTNHVDSKNLALERRMSEKLADLEQFVADGTRRHPVQFVGVGDDAHVSVPAQCVVEAEERLRAEEQKKASSWGLSYFLNATGGMGSAGGKEKVV